MEKLVGDIPLKLTTGMSDMIESNAGIRKKKVIEARDQAFIEAEKAKHERLKWESILQKHLQKLSELQNQIIRLNEEVTQLEIRKQELQEFIGFNPETDLDEIKKQILIEKKVLKLKKRIEHLEWKYQTHHLTLKEEKELMDQLLHLQQRFETLQEQFITAKQVIKRTLELTELNQHIEEKVDEAMTVTKTLQDMMEQIEDTKVKIMGYLRDEDNYRKLSDELHNSYLHMENI